MNRIVAMIASMIVISCERTPSINNEQEKQTGVKISDDLITNAHEMTLSPAEAKAAILELLRRSSVLDGMDGAVDHLAKSEIKNMGPNVIRFGFVTCNLADKTFWVEIIAPPNMAIYNGILKPHETSWQAEIEDVTRN